MIGGYNSDRFRLLGSFEIYDRDILKFDAHDYLRCQTEYVASAPGQPFGSGDFIDPLTGKPKCYPTGFTGVDGVTVNTIGTSTRAGAAGGPATLPSAASTASASIRRRAAAFPAGKASTTVAHRAWVTATQLTINISIVR